LSAPRVADLESWLRQQRAKLSRGNDLAKAMDYILKRWSAFTRFLDDGRICLSNNAAERAARQFAIEEQPAFYVDDNTPPYWRARRRMPRQARYPCSGCGRVSRIRAASLAVLGPIAAASRRIRSD
jgi:hypothetical protein